MGFIANKWFRAQAIPNNIETTLFTFTLQGINNAFFSATGLKVVSTSGALDFIVRVYSPSNAVNPIDTERSSVNNADGKVDIKTLNQKIFNGGSIRVTVVHFDTGLLHDFENTLFGNGVN